MEFLTNNPGLQHVAEEIFMNLHPRHLEKCKCVNERWENVINNPSFLVRNLIQFGLIKRFPSKWKKAVRLLTENSANLFAKHLTNIFRMPYLYSDYNMPHPIHWAVTTGCPKIVELLATSTEAIF